MPLVISGPISMGGSVTGQSINLELTKAATDIISLNDTDARRLALIIDDQTTISLNDFYGKQLITFGQEQYTSPGTYYWVCPEGITSVSVVCIGGGGGGDAGSDLIGVGGGGGGGALAYRNNVTTIPGETYTIVVGEGGIGQMTVNKVTTQNSTPGGASSAFSCVAGGGANGSRGTAQVVIGSQNASGGQITGVYTAGYAGGFGGTIDTSTYGFRPPGGGGAAGYAGVGGYGGRGRRATGAPATSVSFSGDAAATNGGGGGGGGAGYTNPVTRVGTGAAGGGVGIYGYGSTGAGGIGGSATQTATVGGDGSTSIGNSAFGAGGGGGVGGDNRSANPGAGGAVRIIWPGIVRQFPSTNVINV